MIRRLIRATAIGVTEFHVRTGEGVQLPGWDGIVRNEQDTPFVPEGNSGWEMSVASSPKTKADKDLKNRTEDSGLLTPETTTFVFVTLRRWGGKDVWARQKTEDGPWRRVRVLDADDVGRVAGGSACCSHLAVHPDRQDPSRNERPRGALGRVVGSEPPCPYARNRSVRSGRGISRDASSTLGDQWPSLRHPGGIPGGGDRMECTA